MKCSSSGGSRSRGTASTDSSLGIPSSSALSLSVVRVLRRCRESLSLSSRGSYSVEWRRSGDGSESPNQQGLSRSVSLEAFLCSPLPGQVSVEPPETPETGRTAQGAVEASPANKSSTGDTEETLHIQILLFHAYLSQVFNVNVHKKFVNFAEIFFLI